MQDPKTKILETLNFLYNQKIKHSLITSESIETVYVHGIPRLIINFKGTATIKFIESGSLKTADYPPGSWFYASQNGYLLQKHKHINESISISYYGNYIRAMHISYDGTNLPPTEKDIFYHANRKISNVGQKVLSSLDELTASKNSEEIISHLLKALLKISIDDIKSSTNNSSKFNANAIWININTYMRNHFSEPINRDTVAEHFRISPGYVSHLFQTFSNNNFINTLVTMRLIHAALLLKDSNLTVDEIGMNCGFSYTSYFIRCFKKKYSMTPFMYRKSIRQNLISKIK